MSENGLSATIHSDLDYDHLVAEVCAGDQFLCLLDREDGPENVRVAFPRSNGELGQSVPLAEFVAHLQAVAADLKQ